MVSGAVDSMRGQSIKSTKNYSWKKVRNLYSRVQREATQKHRLFMYPVGNTAKPSPPERNCTTTSS